ncbi:efflux transporter outer membrane subunit [Brucella haematophila]|uniref:efflux transporter outer membrane subunit n=1 Tax=Brucella haematophila TaxID=419474 RepID=UPI001F33825E|nr:efflux transporter outer membrane subunit [Brucella haematophila]
MRLFILGNIQITKIPVCAVLLLLPFGSGCVAVGPDYRSPVIHTPLAWNSKVSIAAPRLADWWKNLGDPVLDKLIADGIEGSPDVATAKAKVRQTRASYAAVGGELYPQLKGTVDFKRSGGSSDSANTASNASLSPSWELDLFGANRRGVEAAYYKQESANELLRGALVSLIGDIATNYVRLRGAQAQIAVTERNAVSQRRTVALTRTQLEAGNISQVDLLTAQTEVATTEAEIPRLRIQYAEYLNTLSVLTGRSSLALAAVLDKPRPLPLAPRRVSAGLPANLLLSRPDIRAAERDYATFTAQIGQMQAALYPKISLVGTINTNGANFGDFARLSTIGWSFGPNITVPLFQGGKLLADIDGARASRDEAFIKYRQVILTGLSEVENASVAFNQNRLRIAQLEKIVRDRRKINELTLDQFKAGSKNFLDVLTAQRGLRTQESALSQARVEIILNYVALQKALGGGWNGRIDVEKPEVVDGFTGPHFVKPFTPATDPTRPVRSQ